MARVARGGDRVEEARQMLVGAKTLEQLRQAQSVVLPLDYGLSLEQTARAIGRSTPGPAGFEIAFYPERRLAMASVNRVEVAVGS